MTLNIIFGILLAIGICLIIWHIKADDYTEWKLWAGVPLVIMFGIALLISIPVSISSVKDSEITYRQLVQEKQTIEIMLDTDKNIDRLLLNERVIGFNNQIINAQENSTRFIYGDYYSKNVDWDTLELIEWR